MKNKALNIEQKLKKVTDADKFFNLVTSIESEAQLFELAPVISRKIDEMKIPKSVNFALLGNFTLDLLAPYIKVSLARYRMIAKCYIAPFGQYFQEVIDSESGLYRFKQDYIILALDLRELSPLLYYQYAELDQADKEGECNRIVEHLTQWVNTVTNNLPSNILLCNIIPYNLPQLGVADSRESVSQFEFIESLNQKIRRLTKLSPQVHLLDVNLLALQTGLKNIIDPKMYYMAKIAWSSHFLNHIAWMILKLVYANQGMTKKCLVLDLDNTLWGGVLGEDGYRGIKVGSGDAISEIYRDFQYAIKSIKERGLLLSICSKNNLIDVEELFIARTDMPLKLSDFSAMQINWEHKHTNIEKISKELNIGLDSMVFIDDNPAEISLVEQMLPDVSCLLLPDVIETIPELFDTVPFFEKIVLLDDDRSKTEQYHHKKQRDEFKNNASPDLETYLHSLGTHLQMKAVDDMDIERIHQLVTKTNQFNLTTIRYSLSTIEKFVKDSNYDNWCYNVSDRFGNLGIVGYVLVKLEGQVVNIDSFIMSCRAMGRQIETAVINWLKQFYLIDGDYLSINAIYIKTVKNQPVKEMYLSQGFELINSDDSQSLYKLKRECANMIDCDWILLD